MQEPDQQRYQELRQAVIRHEGYNGYSDDLGGCEKLYEEKRYEEVRAGLRDAMPNLLLSPRAHMLAALAARHLGDEQSSEMEGFIFNCCMEGILGSGDGTESAPYLVLRVSDEYDVLMHLSKTMRQQALIEREEKSFDVLTCEDGTELWFDITDMHNRPENRRRRAEPDGE
jgi:hypothetical protein